jgi:putative FmdB family regulatory protein
MPIYEYACKNCEHTLDALQKMNEDPLVYCPSCGEPRLKRLISAPSFRLKGKGWYETDFKKDNQRNLLSSDAERQKGDKADAKSGKDDSSKSEGAGKKQAKSKKSSDKKADGKVDSA